MDLNTAAKIAQSGPHSVQTQHGDVVVMTQETYAQLLDKAQKVHATPTVSDLFEGL